MPLVSQNELGGLTEKAWRGISITDPVPWGLVKDSNVMVQWLASRDISFENDLEQCLTMISKNPMLGQNNPLDTGILIAPLHGLIMLDIIMAEQIAWRGQIYGVNFMIAAMGLLVSSANYKNSQSFGKLILSDGNGLAAFCTDTGVYAKLPLNHDGKFSFEYASQDNAKTMEPNSKGLTFVPRGKNHAIEITDKLWKQMLEYAQNSYLPENELSRSRGAGAGNIDND